MAYRILIVDDETDWRSELQDVFRLIGYEADAVEAMSQAEDRLRRVAYDLLLLDIQLDFSSAYLPFQALCRLVRQNFPGLPIVATSGRQIDTAFMWQLRDLGVGYFFNKSAISLEDLRGRFDSLIASRAVLPALRSGEALPIVNIQTMNVFLENAQQVNQSGGIGLHSGGALTVGGDVVGQDKHVDETTPGSPLDEGQAG